jgi:hypothetical protein
LGHLHHHDLGALGAAINPRALGDRLKCWCDGSNALHFAQSPAPELLELAAWDFS